jgi:hypothetical protein
MPGGGDQGCERRLLYASKDDSARHAEKQVTVPRSRLPWGNRYSVILVAATPDGQSLQQFFPIDDPTFDEVLVAPGLVLDGEIHLTDFFQDIDTTVKKVGCTCVLGL